MDVGTGVALNELCCPTCGVRYEDFALHSAERDYVVEQITSPIKAFALGFRFLVCPNGHRWTVKTIWRAVNQPDRVQLDRYLGMAP